MSHNKKIIVEVIDYPSGAKLHVFKDGSNEFIPSQKYQDFIKSIPFIKVGDINKKRIAHNRNKLLFEKGVCVSGDKLLDNLLTPKSKFNFTKISLINNARNIFNRKNSK